MNNRKETRNRLRSESAMSLVMERARLHSFFLQKYHGLRYFLVFQDPVKIRRDGARFANGYGGENRKANKRNQ